MVAKDLGGEGASCWLGRGHTRLVFYDNPFWVAIPYQGLGHMTLFLGSVLHKRTVSVSSGKQGFRNCKFVGNGVVRIEVQVNVRMCLLTVYFCGQGAIGVVSDLGVQEG